MDKVTEDRRNLYHKLVSDNQVKNNEVLTETKTA
jgi:hypothetical protein